jgi:hypothetical protein
MVATDWIETLTVAKLKVELQQRGQAVSGKKTELVARLAAYVVEHEVRTAPGCRRASPTGRPQQCPPRMIHAARPSASRLPRPRRHPT